MPTTAQHHPHLNMHNVAGCKCRSRMPRNCSVPPPCSFPHRRNVVTRKHAQKSQGTDPANADQQLQQQLAAHQSLTPYGCCGQGMAPAECVTDCVLIKCPPTVGKTQACSSVMPNRAVEHAGRWAMQTTVSIPTASGLILTDRRRNQ